MLIEGFFDEYDYINKIMEKDEFLILGPKGSGKSAIGNKIELMADRAVTHYAKVYELKNFPYNRFSDVLPRKGEAHETKYPLNWEFILLVMLIDSFSRDIKAHNKKGPKFHVVIKTLRDLELLPGKSPTDIARVSIKSDFSINLLSLGTVSFSLQNEKKSPDVNTILNILREVCYSINTPLKHFIIIDGLDHVLTTKNENQYQTLSALILAANDINNELRKNKINAKIIILCRTELFEKLDSSNDNKIRQDYSITLDWYENPREFASVNLVKLINLRAKVNLKQDVDVFMEFLPQKISSSDPTVKILLDNTRHTPRDFIELISKIQSNTKGEIATPNEVLNGLREFSLKYFVPEIGNELSGFVKGVDSSYIIDILGTMDKDIFSYEELEKRIKEDSPERFKELNLRLILDALFTCSAIGNFRRGKPGEEKFIFKYRNPYTKFNPNNDIAIHRGLLKGLNIK